jgi:hypothetical protein
MMRGALLSVGIALLSLTAAPLVAAEAKKPAGSASVAAENEKIAADLRTFCKKWMGFLEARERDNRRQVKWQTRERGVIGQFVGYSKEYDCTLKERSSNGTPVATIVYRELIYEQTGSSPQEATAAEARIVDVTSVTEIFRYAKGEWVY